MRLFVSILLLPFTANAAFMIVSQVGGTSLVAEEQLEQGVSDAPFQSQSCDPSEPDEAVLQEMRLDAEQEE